MHGAAHVHKLSSIQAEANLLLVLFNSNCEARCNSIDGNFAYFSSRNVSPRQSASGPSGGSGIPPTCVINRTSNEAWVCPDDRQLALRAK